MRSGDRGGEDQHRVAVGQHRTIPDRRSGRRRTGAPAARLPVNTKPAAAVEQRDDEDVVVSRPRRVTEGEKSSSARNSDGTSGEECEVPAQADRQTPRVAGVSDGARPRNYASCHAAVTIVSPPGSVDLDVRHREVVLVQYASRRACPSRSCRPCLHPQEQDVARGTEQASSANAVALTRSPSELTR